MAIAQQIVPEPFDQINLPGGLSAADQARHELWLQWIAKVAKKTANAETQEKFRRSFKNNPAFKALALQMWKDCQDMSQLTSFPSGQRLTLDFKEKCEQWAEELELHTNAPMRERRLLRDVFDKIPHRTRSDAEHVEKIRQCIFGGLEPGKYLPLVRNWLRTRGQKFRELMIESTRIMNRLLHQGKERRSFEKKLYIRGIDLIGQALAEVDPPRV